MKYLLLVALVLFAPFVASAAPLTDSTIRTIIAEGVSWLSLAQEESGHFRYEYLPYEGIYRKDDNIVRQAGAFFELGEIERMDSEDAYSLEEVLGRSAEYFESISKEGTFNGTTFRCVKAPKESACKLGATALVAIGLMDFIDAYPKHKATYEPLLTEYRDYMLAMKKESAGFRYYFYPSRKTQRDDESSFSNGEAFLALVRYETRAPDTETRKVIDETFSYLEKTPFDTALYLWAMAGVRDLNVYDSDLRYRAYAERYTTWRLADNANYQNSSQNRCAYIEGLASAHTILKDTPLATTLREEIDTLLSKTAHLQIQPVNLYRAIGGELRKLEDSSRARGGFLTGFSDEGATQRIDYTQHCLSAYAQTLVDIRSRSL